MTARRIAGIAALSALALVSFLIESLFPPLLLPGAKLGLGNIFVLAALFFYGGTGGMIALAVKLLLGNLITGNLSALMYGLPAGALSYLAEYLLIRFVYPRVSVIAVSVFGAALSNAAQTCIFAAVIRSSAALVYLPYLVLLGVLSGAVVGTAVYLILKRFPRRKQGGSQIDQR